MTHGVKTIIIPVRDLAAAKTLYGTALGVEPYADEPYSEVPVDSALRHERSLHRA